eukprot:INCI4094.3.p1 GENE.INCI4094.3~~INCI4094.3.p1  ORF type:complete len:316 (+),score=68.88 INCI4094.3:111-1058(+)
MAALLRRCVSSADIRLRVSHSCRAFSAAASNASSEFTHIAVDTKDKVTTVTMNRPKKYNAWTKRMMDEIFVAFDAAAASDDTEVVVLTGNGDFYCAGVDLSAILRPMVPSTLHGIIVETNQQLFDKFLDFPKPTIAAVNGPAIGASVTSATLCDAIVASDKATFHTPFQALGLCPEGCSSVHFAKIMGDENARRMLDEGWKPTAQEAKDAGMVDVIVEGCTKADDGSHPQLRAAAHELAQEWIANGFQRRTATGERNLAELKAANAAESRALANAFFGLPFLQNQRDFAKSRGKTQIAAFFSFLIATRPVWALGL